MNKPQIRFKGFNDEWEVKALSSPEFSILAGGDVNKIELKTVGTYPVIANALSNEGILGYYNNYYRIKSPAISITGRGEVGVAVPRRKNFTPVVRLLALTSPNDIDFLSCAINKHPKILESTGVPQLTVPKLQSYNIHFPSHTEQSQIGTYFRQLDEMIAEVEREISRLEKMKQASLQKMFPRPGTTTPEIRFAGFTDEWNIKSLGEIGSTYTGLSGKTKEDFGHGDAHFVTFMNVFSNPIASAKQVEPIEIDKSQYAVRYGDIFFTTSSETPEEVGMSSVWLYDKEHIYLNSFCFGFRPNIKIDLKYFAYFLRSPFFRSKMVILAQGISRFNISKLKAMEQPVLLPSLAEQEAIGNYFHNLDYLITSKRLKLAKLRNIKQACLYKMFVNTSEL